MGKIEEYREWLKALVWEINNNGQHRDLCIALLVREKRLMELGQLSRPDNLVQLNIAEAKI